ncbi:MAG: undecaprenyl-diphosphatase UppP [Candidatus Electryonea clarkiae]|nr:undecaprenyl-diphosphatase UppP [Candidatus Electryonea clarkiae]MDP8288847.1 undecaprenyl-diphosphatase UppP [Candidatus Electryonea clarkiae]
MNLWQALILGIVQGLTEFLPISSSGHLVIVNHLLGISDESISFEVAVHIGTLVSVLVYFRKDIIQLFVDFFRGGEMRRVGWMILLAMVPTGIIGLSLSNVINVLFESPKFAAGGLFVTAIILFIAEKIKNKNKLITDTRWKNALLIGAMQGMAIMPGISRSGSTIAAGLFSGLSRDAAARFSFLLAIPAILAAAVYELKDFSHLEHEMLLPFAVGTCASMISGYLAIGALMAVLRRGKLYGFSIYTIIVGSLVLILL